MQATGVGVEEAHRGPEHAVLPSRRLQQIFVRAHRPVEDGEEASGRYVPTDSVLSAYLGGETRVESIEHRAEVATVEVDLLLVRGAQTAIRRHEHATDDGLRDRGRVD